MGQAQREFIQIMREVARVERQVHDLDKANGTLRPEGPSLGHIYERLGLMVTAMCRCGFHPCKALGLIQSVAEMSENDRNFLLLLGGINFEGDGNTIPLIKFPLTFLQV
jgi:hypothetical protein